MYSPCLFVALLSVLRFVFSNTTPLVVPWNTTQSYGPDGPWSVVTVQVGNSDAQGTQPLATVDLFPGGIYESMILRHNFCNDNGTVASDDSQQCLAEKAGLYPLVNSTTVQQGFTDAPGLIWQWGSNEAEAVNGIAVNVLDTMRIPTLDDSFTVNNSTISAVRAWQIDLPDGTKYSAQVGTLSLGAPGTGLQTFNAKATGQTVSGYAYAQDEVASNSRGLHYGSASLNQGGSLVFGGYDQSRVLGDVGAFDLAAGSTMLPNLLDIQIGVENGTSPFSESSYTNLLKLNASFNGVQPAVINPIVPYLFMSPETCAAVAENLPVTLNSQLGLYIWNTTDPQYERIVQSSAYLALIFQKAGSGNLTIKVSFQLLNLTLEPPMVTTSQQYLPCRPFHALDNSGNYFLGKAFLQAAFIGMNWQKEKFFLAQAPGPGVGASNISSIQSNDTTINSDPIENFVTTWARNWEAISDNDNDNNTTPNPTHGQNEPSVSGLSSGAKVGIAVGVVVGVLAVAGAVWLFYMRRRMTGMPPQEIAVPKNQNIFVHEKDGVAAIPEIGEGLPRYEADEGYELHELAARETP